MSDLLPWEENYASPEGASAGEKMPWEENYAPVEEKKDDETPSFAGSFAREAGRSVLPGTAGVLAGAASAGAAGLLAGPAAPIVAPIAALGGGIYAAMKAREYQDEVANEIAPDSFMGTKSAQADAEAHPVATFGGSLVGMGKPSASALSGAVKAFGTTAGRQGIKTIAKQIGSKEAREAVKDATTKKIAGTETLTPQAIEALEAQKVAGEHFGHAIGAAGGVGAMTGMGIAEGEDPGTAALKGVAGLAVKPWVGPRGVFLDPFKPKSSGKTGDSSQSKVEPETEEEITGTSEDILGNAEKELSEADSKVSAAADVADQSGASETASALRETLTRKPRSRKTKKTASSVESTATQPETKLENETQITEEPATENASDSVEAIGQQIPPEPNVLQTDVLPEVSDEESVEPPLESSADEQTQQGASAATETPVASQAALPVEQIRTPEQYLDNRGGLGRLKLNERLAPTKKFPEGQPSLQELLDSAVRNDDLESLQWIHNEMRLRQGTKPSFQKEEMVRRSRAAIVRLSGQEPVAPELTVSGENGAPRVVKGGPDLNSALQDTAGKIGEIPEEPSGTESLEDVEPPDEAVLEEPEPEPEPTQIEATDKARERAEALGVNLEEVTPSNGKRIIVADVQRHANKIKGQKITAPVAEETPVEKTTPSEPSSEQPAPNYWYRDEASQKFFEESDRLRAELEREQDPAKKRDLASRISALRTEYQRDPEKYSRVDLNNPIAKIYDAAGVPTGEQVASLAGARWRDLGSSRIGDLNLREVTLADGKQVNVDLDTLPEPVKDQIDNDTPVLKRNISAISKASGRSRNTIINWEREGMPSEDVEQALAWIEARDKEKSMASSTREAAKSASSLDATLGDGTASIGDTYVGTNPTKPSVEKDNSTAALVNRAISHMERSDVPAERRLAVGKLLQKGEIVDQLGMTDEDYIRVSKAVEKLENELHPTEEIKKAALGEGGEEGDLSSAFEAAEGKLISLEKLQAELTPEQIKKLADWMESKGILTKAEFKEINDFSKKTDGKKKFVASPEDVLDMLKTSFEAAKERFAAAQEAWKKSGSEEFKQEEGKAKPASSLAEIDERATALAESGLTPDQLMDNVDGEGEFDVSPLRSIDAGSQDNNQTPFTRGEPLQEMHGGELIDQILAHPKTSSWVKLVARVLRERNPALEKVAVRVYRQLEPGTAGEYDPAQHEIALQAGDGEAPDASVALHEMFHALTAAFFRAKPADLTEPQKQTLESIKKLFVKAREEAVKMGLTSEDQWMRAADTDSNGKLPEELSHYGWSKVEEFVSEAMTNPDFQKMLNQIQIRDEVTGKVSGAWDKLKDWILKALRIQVEPNSALHRALHHIMDLSVQETPIGITREGKVVRGAKYEENLLDQNIIRGVNPFSTYEAPGDYFEPNGGNDARTQVLKSPQKKTSAFEEPTKLFSAELQKALGDVHYSSFQWKEDAGHVSKWLNDSAAKNGSTWETLVMDLTSPDPTPGLSDRQKMVGKFMLTQSLDKAATELRGKGKTNEAARYNKLAKTLFKSAKLDASSYGQGLNSVRMLTELINGNTALSEYVDPISKVHYEKLAGKSEVADVLGTLKGSMETGADTTVAKAGPLLEKIKGQLSGAEIARIVKEALLNPESSLESLSAELADAANLPVEKVTSVADALRKAFAVEARKSAREELEKLVKNAQSREERAKIKKIVDSDSDKLMRLIGMGAMSEEKYYNAIAKTYGLPSWDPTFAKFVEKEGGKISALPESMKDYRQQRTQRLIGEIAKKVRTEKLNNKDAGEIADVLTTFWQLGVLSGPPTQVVNAVASGASIIGESMVEGLGAAIRTRDPKHLVEAFSGFLQAITGNKGAKGVLGQEFIRALSEGTSKYKNSKGETLSSMETLPDEKDLFGAMKLVSRYGNVLKYVGRSMAAFDSANMAMAEAAAERKSTRYYLQTEKGLKGEALESAMNDLFSPDETTTQKFRTQAEEEVRAGYYADESPANQKRWVERRVNELLSQRREELTGGEISEKAMQAAERFTYNDDARGILGQFAGFMNQINQETKVSKFVISFMKTMMNLVNQSIDWSPYGALRAANKSFSQSRFKEGSRFDPYRYEEGSPEQYAQYARAILGTMAWTGLAYLAYKGLEDEKSGKPPTFSIHGSGPSNAYDRQQLLATRNWQPNSIRVGNTWLRYTDWPVLGIALGGMGSFFDSQRYAKDDSTTSEKLFAGVMATASTVLDKNMLQGVSNLFEGIRQSNSPTQQANALKRLVSGSVGGFTNPGLARWARNSFYMNKDGMVNRLDQSTTEGWLYSMVPFSAGYNTPALNTLGEPLQQPWYSATMWRFADVNGVPPHPIITPLVKAGLMLPNPSKNTEFRYLDKMGDVQKTKVGKYPEINRRFVELRGQAMKELLTPEAIGDLSRAAKENVNEAQTYLDSRVGRQARKYAVSMIEQEIQEGKLHLD